jgi:uncharacterized SAM-binding protein YcdF (DUF218 family)
MFATTYTILPDSFYVFILLVPLFFLILRYLTSHLIFRKVLVYHLQGSPTTPPTVPHVVPWLGNALHFFVSPMELVNQVM